MPGAPKMDLGDAVLHAHRAHKESSQSPPAHSDSQGAPSTAGGTTGGIPEAHALASPSSPTSPTSPTSPHSFFHSTPPQSPLKKTATNTSSNTGSTPRPKHRSQASFDWFGTEGRDVSSAREQIGRGSGRTESPGGGGTGPSNAAALRFPGGAQPRGITKKASHDGPLAESPMERSEDEAEDSDRLRGNGLRGAFTAEDKMRGANALRQWSGDSTDASTGGGGGGKKDKIKRKTRERSASMGAVEGSSTGRSRSLSLSRNTKAKSVRHAGGEGDEADWEDEGRDQFAEGGPFAPNGGVGSPRKHSMWGGAAGFLAGRGGGDHSGTSTPDAASDREDGGQSLGGEHKTKRPMAQRRGSAWGVVRNKLGKGGKPAKKKTGETLTGHELISVSLATPRRLCVFRLADLLPLFSVAPSKELTTGILPMVLVKMSLMDRDERGDHRIPILMNYLSEACSRRSPRKLSADQVSPYLSAIFSAPSHLISHLLSHLNQSSKSPTLSTPSTTATPSSASNSSTATAP